MNLRSLRCFVAVAEELNFNRAAGRLNMSQPPLTQHIKSLEHQLGATLFYRTKRSVRISEVGAALLDEARRLLAQADGLPHLVQRAKTERCGYLRAGFVASAIFTKVRSLYAKLSNDVPGVLTLWQEMNSAEQIDALRSGKLDIAFVYLPADYDDLEVRTVARDPIVVTVPERHRFAKRAQGQAGGIAQRRFRAATSPPFATLLRPRHFGLPGSWNKPNHPSSTTTHVVHSQPRIDGRWRVVPSALPRLRRISGRNLP